MVNIANNSRYFNPYAFQIQGIGNIPPKIVHSQTFSVNENAANGTIVGMVLVNELEVWDNVQDWMIISGNDDNIFSINSNTGTISVQNNKLLDYESIKEYSLVINVSDGYATSYPDTILIDVLDVNETGLDSDLTKEIYFSPNPISSNLIINNLSNKQIKKIVIYDITGKQIINLNECTENNIDVSYLKPGIYELLIQLDKLAIQRKFIKN